MEKILEQMGCSAAIIWATSIRDQDNDASRIKAEGDRLEAQREALIRQNQQKPPPPRPDPPFDPLKGLNGGKDAMDRSVKAGDLAGRALTGQRLPGIPGKDDVDTAVDNVSRHAPPLVGNADRLIGHVGDEAARMLHGNGSPPADGGSAGPGLPDLSGGSGAGPGRPAVRHEAYEPPDPDAAALAAQAARERAAAEVEARKKAQDAARCRDLSSIFRDGRLPAAAPATAPSSDGWPETFPGDPARIPDPDAPKAVGDWDLFLSGAAPPGARSDAERGFQGTGPAPPPGEGRRDAVKSWDDFLSDTATPPARAGGSNRAHAP